MKTEDLNTRDRLALEYWELMRGLTPLIDMSNRDAMQLLQDLRLEYSSMMREDFEDEP